MKESKKQKILKEFGYLIGIISEGLGSQYKCFIEIKGDVTITPLKKKKNIGFSPASKRRWLPKNH